MPNEQQRTASDLSEQAIALAEQLGHIAGTIEGTAEAWLKKPSLAEQLMRVRDGASQMLQSLGAEVKRTVGTAGRKKPGGKAQAAPRARKMADLAHAPGKRRRKPAPSKRGVKKSDERIPKARVAAAVRRRRKYT